MNECCKPTAVSKMPARLVVDQHFEYSVYDSP